MARPGYAPKGTVMNDICMHCGILGTRELRIKMPLPYIDQRPSRKAYKTVV
jgi:hypothetical protein